MIENTAGNVLTEAETDAYSRLGEWDDVPDWEKEKKAFSEKMRQHDLDLMRLAKARREKNRQIEEEENTIILNNQKDMREQVKQNVLFQAAAPEGCVDGTDNVEVFTYQQYLSDNPAILNRVVSAVRENGQKLLIAAGCGGGKTALMLTDLQKALYGQKTVLVCAPNTVQCEQNAKYEYELENTVWKTLPVTANAKFTPRITNKNALSVVYDSIGRYFKPKNFDMHFEDIVFVVDEAHLMFAAKNYRQEAIKKIEEFEERVLSAGGTVIYMTGTPRKLGGYRFNARLVCLKSNKNTIISDCNVQKVTLLQKKTGSHAMNMAEFTASVIKDLCQSGKVPFVRINNKKSISRIADACEEFGIKTETLTSDDKVYSRNHFASNFFLNIMKFDQLPQARAYLVTSVMEVGTSIKNIAQALNDKFGTTAKEMIVPVYVCLNPDDMDPDNIKQFFARPRFNVENAYILTPLFEEKEIFKNETPSFMAELTVRKESAEHSAQILNISGGYHKNLVTMQGKTEESNTFYANNIFSADMREVYGKAVASFYRKIYMKPFMTSSFLTELLGIPVETGKAVHEKTVLGQNFTFSDEDIKQYHHIAWLYDVLGTAEKAGFASAICEGYYKNDYLYDEVRRCNHGAFVMAALEKIAPCGLIDTNPMSGTELMDTALRMVSLSRKGASELFEQVVLRMIGGLRNMYEPGAVLLTQYHARMIDNKIINDNGIRIHKLSDIARGKKDICYLVIQKLFSTKEFGVFMRYASTMLAEGRCWSEICDFAASHSLKDMEACERQIVFVEWNKLETNTKLYDVHINPAAYILGAQYHVLRNPENYFFDKKGSPLFEKGFIGMHINGETLNTIAKNMDRAVFLASGKRRKRMKYTAEMVMGMLRCIYSCTIERDTLRILALRKKIYTGRKAAPVTQAELISSVKKELAHRNGIKPEWRGVLFRKFRTFMGQFFSPEISNCIMTAIKHRIKAAAGRYGWREYVFNADKMFQRINDFLAVNPSGAGFDRASFIKEIEAAAA